MHYVCYTDVIVGFEETLVEVNEPDGTAELCAVVTSPPAGTDFPTPFNLLINTASGTAGLKTEKHRKTNPCFPFLIKLMTLYPVVRAGS